MQAHPRWTALAGRVLLVAMFMGATREARAQGLARDVPIHPSERVFSPDEVRIRLRSARSQSPVQRIFEQLAKDPENLRTMLRAAQKANERLGDSEKLGKALQQIPPSARWSELAKRLQEDQELREKLLRDPEIRKLAQDLAKSLPENAMKDLRKSWGDDTERSPPSRDPESRSQSRPADGRTANGRPADGRPDDGRPDDGRPADGRPDAKDLRLEDSPSARSPSNVQLPNARSAAVKDSPTGPTSGGISHARDANADEPASSGPQTDREERWVNKNQSGSKARYSQESHSSAGRDSTPSGESTSNPRREEGLPSPGNEELRDRSRSRGSMPPGPIDGVRGDPVFSRGEGGESHSKLPELGKGRTSGQSATSGEPLSKGAAEPKDAMSASLLKAARSLRELGGPMGDSETLHRTIRALETQNVREWNRTSAPGVRPSAVEEPIRQWEAVGKQVQQSVDRARRWTDSATGTARTWTSHLPNPPVLPRIPLPKLDVKLPKLPKVELPRFSVPSVPRVSPKLPEFGPAVSLGVVIITGLVAAAGAFWLSKYVRLAGRGMAALRHREEYLCGAPTDRVGIVRAFEGLAIYVLGESARSRHHREIAERLAGIPDASVGGVHGLADLYEKARYAPPEERLTEDELREGAATTSMLAKIRPI